MRCVILSFCLFATACGGVSPSAPTASSAALGQVGVTDAMLGSELPFRGTLEAQEVHTGAFPVLHSVLTGNGQATHLGRFTAEFVFDITIGGTAPSTTTGTFTLTAANGDSISGAFTGTGIVANGMVTIVENATIAEGTGRFANATGTFRVDRIGSQSTLRSSGSLNGTINLGH
jgi:hypothetical protein